MPDLIIRLSEQEWALLDSIGAEESLSVDEAALNIIRERLRQEQDEALDFNPGEN